MEGPGPGMKHSWQSTKFLHVVLCCERERLVFFFLEVARKQLFNQMLLGWLECRQ